MGRRGYKTQLDFSRYFKQLYLMLAEYYWVVLLLISMFIFRKIVLIAAFVLLAALPQLYKRVLRFPLGLEFLTFFTVVIAYWQGPFIAWITTFPMVLLSVFFSGSPLLPKYRFIKYALTCVFIFVLISFGATIVTAGGITTIVVNSIGIIMAAMFSGAKSLRTLPSKIINIFLNLYLFGHFGQQLINMLSIL